MTRYYSGRDISRTPHTPSTKRPTIRNNPIHYFRSIFLPRLFLSLLPLKPGTNSWARRLLTPYRHHNPQPIWSSPAKYCCTPGLRRNRYMSPSQHYRRKPKRSYPISCPNHPSRILLHPPSSNRILWSPLHNCRRSLRLYFLRSNRLPRTPRNYWLNFLSRLSISTNPIPFYIPTPLRIWSSCLILTLCRCRLTLPLYLYLLMRIISF